MKVTDQIKVFREVILFLFRTYEVADRQSNDSFFAEIGQTFPGLSNRVYSTEELETLLPQVGSKISGSLSPRIVCLPVTEHGPKMQPCLEISFNFGCSIPEVSLRIGLLGQIGGEVYGFGFRLDSPHGMSAESGIHHYFHLQMIKSLAGKAFPLSERLNFISESEPSFPIDAGNSAQMLLCLIVGLYGRNWTNQFVRQIPDPYVKNTTLEAFRSMQLSSVKNDSLKWYWKLSSDAGSVFYYETDYVRDEFLKYATALHQKHKPSEVIPEEYEVQPTNDRKLQYLKKPDTTK